jgi:hypothetical protein
VNPYLAFAASLLLVFVLMVAVLGKTVAIAWMAAAIFTWIIFAILHWR